MGCVLDNSCYNSRGYYMGSFNSLDIAGHILNFGIWIYLLVIAFKINFVTFNMVLLPLLGLIGSLIFNIIKIYKGKR